MPTNAEIRGPVFFLSYGQSHPRSLHAPREPNREVVKLYVELCRHVYEVLGLATGSEAGYMDGEMDGGQDFGIDLVHAINHCQVFVPLISPHYLSSEWCAREWHAFHRRTYRTRPNARPSPGETPVIPVVWSAVETDQLPVEMRRLQLFTPTRLPEPNMAALYRQEGLYGLRNLGRAGHEAYDAVVWRLAQRIGRAFGTHEVDPGEAQNLSNLPNHFGKVQS